MPRRFEPTLESVHAARDYVKEELAGADRSVRETLDLVVTELASNAIIHAQTPFDVTVAGGDTLRLTVWDGSPRPVVRRETNLHSLRGRGLDLVDHLCHRWGVDQDGARKGVWCELDAGDPPGPAPGE